MNHAMNPLRAASRGVTLVEQMVVVALVVILGAMAVPSMRRAIDGSRITGTVNGFAADLQFARSEAITRGLPITVCPSTDGLNCLAGDVWQSGWIVFVDPAATGTAAAADSVLRKRKALVPGDRFEATSVVGPFTYGRDGLLLALPTSAATLRAQATPGHPGTLRCIAINRTGRHVVQQGGTGDCA